MIAPALPAVVSVLAVLAVLDLGSWIALAVSRRTDRPHVALTVVARAAGDAVMPQPKGSTE